MECTLESGIVVPVRLLIFEKFSHQYFLIPASTFISFFDLLRNGLKIEMIKANIQKMPSFVSNINQLQKVILA